MKPFTCGKRKIKKQMSPDERFFLSVIALISVMAALLIFSTGCSSTGSATAAPATPKYELLLTGTIDGQKFEGVGVGSVAAHHSMSLESAIPVNYFTMDSCHRSIQFTDIIPETPWYQWWADSRGFNWSYDEAPTIEDSGDCILRFCAFSKAVGSPPASCAIIDFKSAKYTLPGKNICNGAYGDATGTALCHTKVGLIERFQFPGPVIIAPQQKPADATQAPYWIKDQCLGKFIDSNQTLFEYQMPENECVAIFMEVAKPHRRAKLTAIPYDAARYPGGN